MTTRKPLTLVTGKDSIHESLGITEEKAQNIVEKLNEMTNDGKGSFEEDGAKFLNRVWTEFEDDAECAFALFLVGRHAEEVSMISLAGLAGRG